MQELEVYDLIGMEYYYLNDIPKAQFYHERMMRGELEPLSAEKMSNLEDLEMKRRERAGRDKKAKLSVFESYKAFVEKNPNAENIILPHENSKELFKLTLRKMRYSTAEPLPSPKFTHIDLKTKIINNINRAAQAECPADAMQLQRTIKR